MNEQDQPAPPPIISAPVPDALPALPPPKPLSWWLRKFFACNPFYLVSAALLLYGCYRVSIDAPMFNVEKARLIFNFTAIQLYEILLVVTAIFLARRLIWYDATLLVGLENLLVFAPFIFISQAALTDSSMALTMCLVGGAVAVARFAGLKRYFTQLNLPGALLGVGFVLLVMNIALPLIYRSYGEHIIGGYINSGPAHAMNLRVWMLVLPAMVALANFLPRPGKTGILLPQHRWLPLGLCSLWMVVTCLHLYSLGYVYQFDFFVEQTTPALLVLLWTIYVQANRQISKLGPQAKAALMFLPALVPLFAVAPENGNRTYLALAALDGAAYLGLCLHERRSLFPRHLLVASVLMFAAGLPEAWLQWIAPGLSNAGTVVCGAVAYLLFWVALSRNPKLAIPGAIALGVAVASVLENCPNSVHLGFQSGLIFLLLHSLRWNSAEHPGANAVRILVALAWVMESFVWVNSPDARFWMPCIPALLVLTICLAAKILGKVPCHLAVLTASALVMGSGPGSAVADGMRSMPVGLLAVLGSLLLFGFGTAAALTRHLWHRNGHAEAARRSQNPTQ